MSVDRIDRAAELIADTRKYLSDFGSSNALLAGAITPLIAAVEALIEEMRELRDGPNSPIF